MKKEFIQMVRDRRLMPLIFLAPVLQLILFGYVVSTDVKHISLAFWARDKGKEGRSLLSKFTNTGFFNLVASVENRRDMKEVLDGGKAQVVLVIPEDFSQKLKEQEPTEVQLVIDGSDGNLASSALGYASRIIQSWNEESRFPKGFSSEAKARLYPEMQQRELLSLRTRIWYNPGLKSVYFMIPGLVSILLMVTTMILTSVAIVKERERGTLEQLIVTPIRRFELILGKTLPFVLVGLVDVALIIATGYLWFRIPVEGSLFLLFGFAILFILNNLGFGLFVSTVSRTQQQAMVTSFFFLLPAFILSGFIFPIENMPLALQYVSYLIPMRYFLVIVRGIFLKGSDLAALWQQGLALALFGLIVLVSSVMLFRKKIWE